MKNGWKTTEFWVTVAASAVAVLNQAFDWKIPTETVTQFIGAVAAYVLSRGLAKKQTPQ
mgnify:CR=1 FL=1